MIPYGRQSINKEDIDAVIKVLKSDFLTQGPQVPLFEERIADYCGARYASATNSATSALHIACLALDLGEGDILWTSPNSFAASANCGLYCGATIDFVDINKETYNISISCLKKKLKKAKKENKLPKILIPVHFAGQSCKMEEINNLSKEYGFSIIEDASHAIGAKYKNKPIGSCQFSDITIFSFHPVKIITTAEGGVAVTNSKKLFDRLELYRSHGITRNQDFFEHNFDMKWYYEQIKLGYNYRMNDIQAALGISQMERLDEFVSQRKKISMTYNLGLQTMPVNIPYQLPESESSFHLYPIQLSTTNAADRNKIFNQLIKSGIGVNVHYIPIHFHPFYKKLGFKPGDFPNCENYYSKTISLPIHPKLTKEQQEKVISVLGNVLQNTETLSI